MTLNTFSVPYVIKGLKKNGASWNTSANFLFLVVFSTLLDMIVTGEPTRPIKLLGFLLFFVGTIFLAKEKTASDKKIKMEKEGKEEEREEVVEVVRKVSQGSASTNDESCESGGSSLRKGLLEDLKYQANHY